MGPVRRVLNRAGPFVVGFVVMLFALVAAYRAWGLPMYAELENVAHAGGGIGNVSYINGLVAFNNSYANGFRYFEVDFLRTRDKQIVCSHDWAAFDDKSPTIAQFMDYRATQQYPNCTLKELLAWFRLHPDATLIADTKIDVVGIDTVLQDELGGRFSRRSSTSPKRRSSRGMGAFPLSWRSTSSLTISPNSH